MSRGNFHPSSRRIHIEDTMYGAWHVLSYAGMVDKKKSAYLCECTICGERSVVRTDRLRSGKSTKCRSCAELARKNGVRKAK